MENMNAFPAHGNGILLRTAQMELMRLAVLICCAGMDSLGQFYRVCMRLIYRSYVAAAHTQTLIYRSMMPTGETNER